MKDSLAASELINRAFGLAKKSGKPNWWIMTLPVLKNRLLQLTNGSFKESEFGASSFRSFLEGNEGQVRIDDNFSPSTVALKSAEDEPAQDQLLYSHKHNQVRPELWRAIFDYSSGNKYEWDIANTSVRISADDGQGPFLPTLTQDEMRQWKAEFITNLAENFPSSERLLAWQNANLPITALPLALHAKWNSFLKDKAENRLKAWFNQQGISAPIITQGRPVMSSYGMRTEVLRSFVIECVKHMSEEELDRIPIPASVALRIKSKG